ncbi:globin-F1-like [Haemaphysalis longicornis]
MGLTDADKKAIRSVWIQFCKSHPDYGMTVFHAFLLKHPEHLNLFKDFRGRTLRSLTGHPKFKAHCIRVGNELTHLINALDNPRELLQVALNIALIHQRQRDVKVAYFTSFSHTLIDVLVTEHKNLMTSETKAAWHRLLEAFVRLISAVYSEASRDAVRSSEGYKPDLPPSNDRDPGPAAEPSSPRQGSKDSLGKLKIDATDTTSGSNASIAPSG